MGNEYRGQHLTSSIMENQSNKADGRSVALNPKQVIPQTADPFAKRDRQNSCSMSQRPPTPEPLRACNARGCLLQSADGDLRE